MMRWSPAKISICRQIPIHPTFSRLPPKPDPSTRAATASGKNRPPGTTTDVPSVTMMRYCELRVRMVIVVSGSTSRRSTRGRSAVSSAKPSSVATRGTHASDLGFRMVDESFTPLRKLYVVCAAWLSAAVSDRARRRAGAIDADDPQHLFDRRQSLSDLACRVVAQPLQAVGRRRRAQLCFALASPDQLLQPGRQPEQLEDADAPSIAGMAARGASAPARELAVRVEPQLLDRRR